MKPDSNRPITIEDLLRLKRAERPPAEFWSTFDQELRAKQLAALVGKRPWWHRLPRAVFAFSRYRVSLGATAVVAITLFSVRSDQTPSATPPQASIDAAPVVVHAMPAPESSVAAVAYEPSVAYAPAVAAVDVAPPDYLSSDDIVQPAAVAPTLVAVDEVEAQPAEEHPDSIPLGRAVTLAREEGAKFSTAGHIAVNALDSLDSLDVLSSHSLLDVASDFEARVMPARVAVEPLQTMTPPSAARRSRLLTAMVSTASLEASMRTTARAASRIEEERLYEQIRRFGARGDRVKIKF